jgi:hypothetical protein
MARAPRSSSVSPRFMRCTGTGELPQHLADVESRVVHPTRVGARPTMPCNVGRECISPPA